MPIYTYKCKLCEQEFEEWSMRPCSPDSSDKEIEIEFCDRREDCPGVVSRVFRPGKILGKVAGWSPDKELKVEKHMAYVDEVMAEGTCDSEVKEGKDMLREREKEYGYPEGHLTGDRPKETIEVASKSGAVIDRLELAKKVDEATGHKMDIDKVAQLTNDRIKETMGETTVMERTIKRGKEDLKRRAKNQKYDRGGL